MLKDHFLLVLLIQPNLRILRGLRRSGSQKIPPRSQNTLLLRWILIQVAEIKKLQISEICNNDDKKNAEVSEQEEEETQKLPDAVFQIPAHVLVKIDNVS
jgi:hypothetical protein